MPRSIDALAMLAEREFIDYLGRRATKTEYVLSLATYLEVNARRNDLVGKAGKAYVREVLAGLVE